MAQEAGNLAPAQLAELGGFMSLGHVDGLFPGGVGATNTGLRRLATNQPPHTPSPFW